MPRYRASGLGFSRQRLQAGWQLLQRTAAQRPPVQLWPGNARGSILLRAGQFEMNGPYRRVGSRSSNQYIDCQNRAIESVVLRSHLGEKKRRRAADPARAFDGI